MNQVHTVSSHEVRRVVAQNPCSRRRRPREHPNGVDQEHHIGSVLGQQPVMLLDGGQLGVGRLALADIAADFNRTSRLTVVGKKACPNRIERPRVSVGSGLSAKRCKWPNTLNVGLAG